MDIIIYCEIFIAVIIFITVYGYIAAELNLISPMLSYLYIKNYIKMTLAKYWQDDRNPLLILSNDTEIYGINASLPSGLISRDGRQSVYKFVNGNDTLYVQVIMLPRDGETIITNISWRKLVKYRNFRYWGYNEDTTSHIDILKYCTCLIGFDHQRQKFYIDGRIYIIVDLLKHTFPDLIAVIDNEADDSLIYLEGLEYIMG